MPCEAFIQTRLYRQVWELFGLFMPTWHSRWCSTVGQQRLVESFQDLAADVSQHTVLMTNFCAVSQSHSGLTGKEGPLSSRSLSIFTMQDGILAGDWCVYGLECLNWRRKSQSSRDRDLMKVRLVDLGEEKSTSRSVLR